MIIAKALIPMYRVGVFFAVSELYVITTVALVVLRFLIQYNEV